MGNLQKNVQKKILYHCGLRLRNCLRYQIINIKNAADF
jgi:hypothetical protein